MTFIELTPDVVATRDEPVLADQKGIADLAMRGDSDTISTADGDVSMLRVDEEGRLKVSSKTASFPVTTGNLTTSAQTVAVDVRRASNVMLHVKNTGSVTHAAGAYSFEGSLDSTNGTDGTWFAVQAVRTNANTVESATGTLSMTAGAGLAYAWESSVNAVQWFRIRCTTSATASSIATWTVHRGSYATEPIPASQVTGTQAVSGTVTANMAAHATNNPAKAEDALHATGDVGAFVLSVRRDAMGSSSTSGSGDYQEIATDANGAVWTRERSAPTATLSNVASSATSVTLLALNTARRGATFYNDSTQTLYLKLGATASATSFTVKLSADDYYELPAGYSGVVDGIWASANGFARVTEVTA